MSTNSNLVVLRGDVVGEPVSRELPGGRVVVQFDVRTSGSTVPVAWFDPPNPPQTNDRVVVIGCVQRRFFRVGGATQSRTEVVAEQVVPARRAAKASSLIAAAVAAIT
jgi:single-strand DNA-binding protein